MAKGMDRFEKVYSQGTLEGMEIWVDKRDWSKLFIPFCRLCGWIDTSFRWERKANCIKYVGNTRIGFR